MVKTQHRNHDAANEPAPMFATDADIALAEQLRHRLEERYFGATAASATPAPEPGEIH